MSMTGKSTSWNKLLRSPYPCDHIIQLYTSPEVLVRALARFVGSALEQGEAAVVIAAAKRIAALTKRLIETGYDVASTDGQGAFVTLDERCLGTFMADGVPDPRGVSFRCDADPRPPARCRLQEDSTLRRDGERPLAAHERRRHRLARRVVQRADRRLRTVPALRVPRRSCGCRVEAGDFAPDHPVPLLLFPR